MVMIGTVYIQINELRNHLIIIYSCIKYCVEVEDFG